MDDLALDQLINDFLKDTFDFIPVLFAGDAKTIFFLTRQKANMVAYTKKMWQALGARSIVDYVTLTANLGQAFIAANPKLVHSCETYAACTEEQLAWVQSQLKITLTEAEHEGREALTVISIETASVVNKKLQQLQATRKG